MPLPARLIALGLGVATAASFAQEKSVEAVTRQPDAYNTWKLALNTGGATDPKMISVPAGFEVELLRSALPEEDSWVSLAFDPQGRITVGCEKKGLLRFTLGAHDVTQLERINDTLLECRGLLYAYGALYAVANNSKAFVRLRSTKGDGQFDEIKELLKTDGGVGHGRNHVKLGPDGMLYLAHGNNVVAPPAAFAASPLRRMQDDRLIPCPWDPQMFDGDVTMPAGHILRTDPEGETWQLIAGGFRNPLDIAWNEDGELFTFDADMEWDTGTPWYRPTRVNHVLPGADYGWRRGTSKWPEYYPDAGPTVVDIGLSSPTGVIYGTRARFPAKWQHALFICDWAYGRIMAVHLQPKGATYTGTVESFVTGKPLNVTDAAIGPDGAMYFTTGGRRTQSGLYRVRYVGAESTAKTAAPVDAAAEKARALRRHLEISGTIAEAARLCGDADPAIRLAARNRMEEYYANPQDDVFPDLGDKPISDRLILTDVMATARTLSTGKFDEPIVERLLGVLNHRDFSLLDDELQILALRDYHIALARLGPPGEGLAKETVARLDALYPAKSWQANHLLCELLVYFNAPSVVEKTLALLGKAERSEDFMEYLFYLRNVQADWTIEQRHAYFTALNHAETLEGARDYARSMRLIRAEYAATLTDSERQALGSLVDGTLTPPVQNTGPQVLVKAWTEADLLPRLERVSKGRSYEGGLMAFASAQCIVCHRFGKTGGLVGPDLTGVASRFSRKDILTSILEPSKVIDEKYRNTLFELKSGATVVGMVESEDDESVYVRVNPTSNATTGVPKSLIVKREASNVSPMPPGLLNTLSEVQILDLLAFLESGGDAQHGDFRK